MTPHKRAITREPLHFALKEDRIVWKLARHKTGITEHRANTTLDVRPGVGAGCSGLERQRVEVFLFGHEQLSGFLQRYRPLVEGHGPQRDTSDPTAVFDHLAHIDAARIHVAHGFTADSIHHRPALSRPCNPLSLDIAFKLHDWGGSFPASRSK